MALMTGNDGMVEVGGTELASRRWTLRTEHGEKNTTNSTTASDESEYLADRKQRTFEFEVYLADDTTEITTGGSAQAIILTSKTGTTDKAWSFNGVLLTEEIVNEIAGGEAVLARYSGRVSGAVTKTQFT